MHQEDLEGCIDDFSLNNEREPGNCTEHIITTLKRIQRLTSQLLKKRFLRVTALLISTKMALFSEYSISIVTMKISTC